MAHVECSACGAKGGGLLGVSRWFYKILGRDLCERCADQCADDATASMVTTTTPAVVGYQVGAYHGVEAVEVFLEATADLKLAGPMPYLGGASPQNETQRRLPLARLAAFRALRVRALERGGNALVGTSFSYFSVPEVGVGVAVAGTVVTLVPTS